MREHEGDADPQKGDEIGLKVRRFGNSSGNIEVGYKGE